MCAHTARLQRLTALSSMSSTSLTLPLGRLLFGRYQCVQSLHSCPSHLTIRTIRADMTRSGTSTRWLQTNLASTVPTATCSKSAALATGVTAPGLVANATLLFGRLRCRRMSSSESIQLIKVFSGINDRPIILFPAMLPQTLFLLPDHRLLHKKAFRPSTFVKIPRHNEPHSC